MYIYHQIINEGTKTLETELTKVVYYHVRLPFCKILPGFAYPVFVYFSAFPFSFKILCGHEPYLSDF